jgi:tetratricopeptide (TPR) repeat protein
MQKIKSTSNVQSWLRILQELPLNKAEKDVVSRFAAEPEGRGFLSVAEILKNHQATEESVELLTEGLNRHPDYNVARVVLARELLARGMIDHSLKVLEEAPRSLKDNLLAQKITLKCSVILNKDAQARALVLQLKSTHHLDEETRYLVKTFEALGPHGLRDRLVEDFAQSGIVLDPKVYPPPQTPINQGGENSFGQPSKSQDFNPWELERQTARNTRRKPLAQTSFAAGLFSKFFNAEEIEKDQVIEGFQVIPLKEIFNSDDKDEEGLQSAIPQALDSATLAEIYSKQGHFTKALEVYKRLLRVTPGHDLIKRRIAELTRLEHDQKREDMTVDPSIVDRMEQISEIDKKMKFLSEIFNKLSHRP